VIAPRVWVLVAATVLSVVSTVLVAVAPGEGPAEARAILVAGFAALAALMGWMTWRTLRR